MPNAPDTYLIVALQWCWWWKCVNIFYRVYWLFGFAKRTYKFYRERLELWIWGKTLSSVTVNCQVTMIVMNSSSQLCEISTILHKSTSYLISLSWSQRSQVSRITLWRLSQNELVFVVVFFHVFVIVSKLTLWVTGWQDRSLQVFSKYIFLCLFLVRSCLLITLIKFLKV